MWGKLAAEGRSQGHPPGGAHHHPESKGTRVAGGEVPLWHHGGSAFCGSML